MKSSFFASSAFFHVALICLLGIGIYANTFAVPMDFDDWKYVTGNPAVQDFRYFVSPELVREAIARDEMNENFRTRIVVVFTFALNHLVHGDRVFGYHLVNLLIHLSAATLVYLLVAAIGETPFFLKDKAGEGRAGGLRVPALLVALFFVAHPVQTQAVTYISQRFTSMATMLYLLSFLLYLFSRKTGVMQTSAGPGSEPTWPAASARRPVYWLAVSVAVLAMLAKEIAFTLPVMLLLCEWMFCGPLSRQRLLALLPFFAAALLIPLIVIWHGSEYEDMVKLSSSLALDGGGNHSLVYLLTQFRVIITYLRLLVLPVHQNLDYDYPHYTSFLQVPVFGSFVVLCLLAGLAFYLFHLSRRQPEGSGRWQRLAAFGIAWFFVTLSVESSVIPLGDVIFEHRLYLPSLGFFLSAFGLLELLRARLALRPAFLILLLSGALAGLSVAALARNRVWHDSVSLWEDTVQKSPAKARAHDNLGRAYIQAGRYAEGIPHLEYALQRSTDLDANFYSLFGSALSEVGRFTEAVVMQEQARRLQPGDPLNSYHLGNAYLGANELDKAAQAFRDALALQPDLASVHGNLGLLLLQQGELATAEYHLEALYRLLPRNADASLILGDLRVGQGRIKEAERLYTEALQLRPDDPQILERIRALADEPASSLGR